jgi:pimeloyl-ACP methyl ester carboxylesterase
MTSPPREPRENGSFVAEVNGFDLHYEVHGSGPVVMTVPNSWGLSLEGLRALYRPLERSFTIVYFDPRGMGDSAPARAESDLGPSAVREDFHALRGHLGLERVHAIGWSNGASNLILIASERPDTIDAAIFLHGVASFDDEDMRRMIDEYPDLFEAVAHFERQMDMTELSREARAARVKRFDTEVWFPYLFADYDFGVKRLPEIYRDTEFSWAHSRATNREWSSLDLRDRLGTITARSLVITGRHDMTPPAKGEEIAAGIPDVRHEMFEHSGHFAPVEEPERFIATVTSFLSR